jgi:hypothetical protein
VNSTSAGLAAGDYPGDRERRRQETIGAHAEATQALALAHEERTAARHSSSVDQASMSLSDAVGVRLDGA